MKESEIDTLFQILKDRLEKRIDEIDQTRLLARIKSRLQAPALKRLLLRLSRFEKRPQRLRLTDRKDLLLLLLYVRGRTGRPAEPILGMTRMMKLLFIAFTELALDTLIRRPYRFLPYKLGPFSPELYDDLEILLQAKLIRSYQIDPAGMPLIKTDTETISQLIALNSGIATVERLDAGQLIIELTPKGRRFARFLLERALKRRKNIISGLEIVKTQFGAIPLTQLLRYVYTRYPEYTIRSEIIEKLFPPSSNADR
ncbi:MAG: hypothetical protein ACUVUR_08115 [bacterium]